MTTVLQLSELTSVIGRHLGYSDWLEVDQARVDLFAQVMGDDQWIHTDPRRAVSGPFGGTIAQGYLTLSLSNFFLPQILQIQGASAGVNYGTDRVRFPAPLRVGERLRAGAEVVAVDPIPGGFQTKIRITMEADGGENPVCVIESLSRYLW